MSLTQAEVLTRTKDLPKDEWLEYRRRGIGGSEIGAICGVNPYRSAMSVYLDKINELPPVEENEAMYFGTLLEPIVASEYIRRTGHKVQRRNAILVHPEKNFAFANVDRIIIDKERGNGILEIKCASEYKNGSWADGIVDDSYQLQLQWYLWVTGYTWGAFAVLVGGNKFYNFETERNEDIIKVISDTAEKFWYGVQNRIPPEFDGSDDSESVLKMLYPASKPDSEIDLTIPAVELLEEYEKAKQEEKYWESQRKEAENKIKGLMEQNERAHVGERLITWKASESHRIDSKRLQDEQPDIYKRYLKTSVSRRFLVK